MRAGIREAADALEAGLGMMAGDVFASVCGAAGLVELADRVRPTVRRRAGIEDGEEPGVGPVTDPSTPGPTDPAAED